MKVAQPQDLQQDFELFLRACREDFQNYLEVYTSRFQSGVADALRYSLMLPSKRMRPIFCLETCQAFAGNREKAFSAASALEMVHTYSLVHDDLPAMDDDDLRRGKPTNHKVYGEARAILAGDGLLTLAFQILADSKVLSPITNLKLIQELSHASGIEGMVLGQDLDIERKIETLEQLENLHRRKTGALLAASVVMGGICADAEFEDLEKLRRFGEDMGLAFQIRDDILDVEGGEELGKPVRSDERNDKLTYVSFLGLETAKQHQQMWTQKAIDNLNSIEFRYPNQLEQLTRYVIERRF